MFQKNIAAGRLKFTTSMQQAVENADVVLIAVGTPPHPITNEADMQYIYAAAEELAPYVKLLIDTSRFISSRMNDGSLVLVDKEIIGNLNFTRNEKE
jgi:UDP-glucose 6-dehydrogenase